MIGLLRYFWVLCIAATLANAFMWWRRGNEARRTNPELAPGYRTMVRGLAAWGSVPWLVMGVGILTGHAENVTDYLDPRGRPPLVHAWFASVVLVWIVGTNWLIRRGGAEALVRHPGLLNGPILNATVLKVLWVLTLSSGIVAVTLSYVIGFQIPAF